MEREDRHYLTAILPSLQSIASLCPDPDTSKLAGDLRVCLATLGAVWSDEMRQHADNFKAGKTDTNEQQDNPETGRAGRNQEENNTDQKLELSKSASSPATTNNSSSSPFQVALSELSDPLIPVQGHALIALTKLIRSHDPETQQNVDTLLQIFRQYLTHSDSYLYLASINGLVELALSAPATSESVLSTLCQEYACLAGKPDPHGRLEYNKETGQPLKPEVGSKSTPGGRLPPRPHDVETRVKLGEALVRVFGELRDLLPHLLGNIVASLMTGVRDSEPMVRASSLSNLAEVCSAGGTVLNSVVVEVCLTLYIEPLVKTLQEEIDKLGDFYGVP